MKGDTLRKVGHFFSTQSALEDGWRYEPRKPELSEKKRKELMEATSLETPRSTLRTVFGVLKPYWTQSSASERVKAASLLAMSLFMTWYAVQVTVDFGHWQSGLGDTVQQLFQTMMTERPDVIADIMDKYPDLQNMLAGNETLHDLLMKFPDTTSITYDPAFKEIIKQNAELADVLKQNPSIEDLFMQFPSFQDEVAKNPDLLEQLRSFNKELGDKISSSPSIKEHLSNLLALSGGDFVANWGEAVSQTYHAASTVAQDALEGAKNVADSTDPNDMSLIKAYKNAWNSNDLATIALKFTGMAIVSYKSAQYLALRWRAWTTGYFTKKWLEAKSFARLRNHFNNIDNPAQRIQEDPAKFTAGAVSLMTGAMNSGMQLVAFTGMLWGMGSMMGVDHGVFWVGLGYAGALTGLTFAAGKKLPKIQRDQQRREADFRKALDNVHNNADVISQNDSENVEQDLIKQRFKPAITNSVREIGTQVKLIIVDSTAGNLSIPIPWLAGAFTIATGAASMGTVQTINYAFNRVTSAMSFLVNRFEQLSQMKATGDRMYMLDKGIDAARYIAEERAQAAGHIDVEMPPAIPPRAPRL